MEEPRVRLVNLGAPSRWLAAGYRDMRVNVGLSLLHGLVIAVFGLALMVLAYDQFWLLAGAASGFLIVAPVLAASLYAMSRAIEKDEPVNLALLKRTWLNWQRSKSNDGKAYWSMVRFGALLGLAATGWVLTSASLITLYASHPVQTPMDFLRYVVAAPNSWLFVIWQLLGAALAAPIFASSVVAMPLLLDRKTNVKQAVLTSWQCVLTNPVPLALWATVLLVLVCAGILTGFLGLVFTLPLLGHASWHAYRDLVDVSQLAARESD